jgi:phosphinothricin acetyltransferase
VGQGVGRAVLGAVIAACEQAGMRRIVAVIGDSGNAASIGLHRSLGFEPAGMGPALGWKFGRWVDIVWMTLPLNGGSISAADAPGLRL